MTIDRLFEAEHLGYDEFFTGFSVHPPRLAEALDAAERLGLFPRERVEQLRRDYGFLRRVENAIQALHEYLIRKTQEQASAESLLRHAPRLSNQLNHRQVALLSHALRHVGQGYTVESHRRSHRVTQQTARTDLLQLAELALLEKGKRGRAFVFYAPNNLRARIEQTAGA